MTRRRSLPVRAVSWVALAIGVLATLVPGSAAVQRSTAEARWPVCGEWRRVPVHPDWSAAQAGAVEVISPFEAWIVGNETPDDIGDVITLRWDGARWVREPFPRTFPIQIAVGDIEAISSDEVWLVGARVDGRPLGVPVAARWNGRRWRMVGIPVAAKGQLSSVEAIPGTRHLWAVGVERRSFDPADDRTLILRRNGHDWRRVASPSTPHGSRLSDVDVSGSVAWAVGSRGPSGDATSGQQPLTLKWNGRSWNTVRTPTRAGGGLAAVAVVDRQEVWAVGSVTLETAPWKDHAALLRWDGRDWRIVRTLDRLSGLADVVAASPRDLWAVGGAGRVGSDQEPVILHRRGGPWRLSSVPDVVGSFTSIDGTPNNLWTTRVGFNMEHEFGFFDSFHRC